VPGNFNNKTYSVKAVFALAALLWFIAGFIHIGILMNAGIGFSVALTDSAISIFFIAACCVLVINNMKYYLPKKEKYIYVLIVSFTLSALWLAVIKIILGNIYKHDLEYTQLLQRSTAIRYTVTFLVIACVTLVSMIWNIQKEQKEENERKADIERLAREAELNKLRQQLQPHFLFNSLNSISALTGSQPEKARHMIQQLSDFLRGTLRNEGQQWTTLEEEIKYLELYLDIEKVRFGYRLQSKIDVPEETKKMKLPTMLLQPLVENAIKFGLYDTIGEVEILIAASNSNGMLQVTVQNPFDETTAMPLKGTGFGISSIKRRLFLVFGRPDLLQIKKEEGFYTAIVNIPQIETITENA